MAPNVHGGHSTFDKDSDAAGYNGYAQAYDRHITRLAGPLAQHACALARLKLGDRVLDVGTGTGVAARHAARMVGVAGRVIAIDLSEGMVRAAEEHAVGEEGPRPDYRVMDAETLELPDCAFDAVISLCAVCHFPDITRALGEMRRVLHPGGRLVVSYGCVHPVSPLARARHVARRLLAKALDLVRPRLEGPGYLMRLAERMLPEPAEAPATEWGGRNRLASLVRAVAESGFESVETSWCGHEVHFDTAEALWEAQSAIVTRVRRRLTAASPDAARRAKQAFIRHAEDVLRRGGRLTYPYGARFVTALRTR